MIYNLIANINNSDRKFIDKFHSFSVNSSMNDNISGGATRPFLQESILKEMQFLLLIEILQTKSELVV